MSEAARRPRLLVLASTYPRWQNDPEPAFVHELARRLTDDFEVHVLAPHAAGACRDEQLDGVSVHRYRYAPDALERLVNAGGILGNLRRDRWLWVIVPFFLGVQAWATWRALRALRPDVVHAHWLIPQGATLAAIRRLGARIPPFVVTSHGADLFALRAAPFSALKRLVARDASRLTVVSDAMRTPVRALGVNDAKIEVRPMGVDLQHRFTPSEEPRSPAELLFVGRLVEKKGLRCLIDALPGVAVRHPEVSLTIVGFGPQETALRARVQVLGLSDRVFFAGAIPQNELAAHYRRATLFVAPFVRAASGDEEGLGLVVVEALGCGCPVLVGEVPAVHDVVGEGCGTIVNAGDGDALAKAIADLLGDPERRARESEAGRRRVLDRFDWNCVAVGYARLLQSISAV